MKTKRLIAIALTLTVGTSAMKWRAHYRDSLRQEQRLAMIAAAEAETNDPTNSIPLLDRPDFIEGLSPGRLEELRAQEMADREDPRNRYLNSSNTLRYYAKNAGPKDWNLADDRLLENGVLVVPDMRHTPPLRVCYYPATNATGKVVYIEK